MIEDDYHLESEEKEILDSFNRGEWSSKGENLDKYKEAAKQTFIKNRRINFRVSEKDFRSIQVKAREEGIPYQTLVSSVVHKYLSGRLK
ncbi:MAG: antitoxin [Spirochaetes bacterium]|nr:MAG: antitoxin [Spirochaetota bacterium]